MEYTQKIKNIRGILNDVNIEHEKIGRIIQTVDISLPAYMYISRFSYA